MLPDRVSNPGPLTYESGALPIALRGPATLGYKTNCLLVLVIIYRNLLIPLICMGLYICCLYSMSLIFHVINKVVYVTIVELAYVIIR